MRSTLEDKLCFWRDRNLEIRVANDGLREARLDYMGAMIITMIHLPFEPFHASHRSEARLRCVRGHGTES